MAGKRIVIIGAGFGGAAAARTARAALDAEHRVTLVDPNRTSYLCGTFPLLIVGARDERKVARSVTLLEAEGVEYVEAEASALDVDGRTVTTTTGTIEYDYLVLATGAEYDWDAVPGAREAHSFYDIESARLLRERLEDFAGGPLIVAVAAVPYKCPPAPYEVAMVLDWAFGQRGVREATDIHVFIPEPAPMPIAGPEAAARISGDLEERGIQLHTGAGVTEVGKGGAEFADGSSMEAELVITIPVHRAGQVVRAAGLTGPGGWVPVSTDSLETEVPGVFAIGDVSMVPMANGKGLPKAGVFASAQGETVGHNIAAAIKGTEPTRFPGVGECFIYYSPTEAGMIRGEFLAAGKPKVSLQPPGVEAAREKQVFEEDWRAFRI